jgi:hypothetical protein
MFLQQQKKKKSGCWKKRICKFASNQIQSIVNYHPAKTWFSNQRPTQWRRKSAPTTFPSSTQVFYNLFRGRNEKDLHGLDKRGPSTLIRVFINGLLTDFIEGNPKMSHFNSMDQYNRGRTWILMWSDLYWIHDPKFRKPSWYYWSETHLIKILKMFAYTVHVACNNRPSSFWNMRKIHWIGCFSFNYGPLIFNYNINLKQVPARDLYFFFLFSFFF